MASLSRAHRESISSAQKARFLALVKDVEQDALNKRKCSTCGEYKTLDEFYRTKEKLKSGLVAIRPDCRCKECRRRQAKERYYRQKSEGVDLKARRERYRENEDAERRQAREREYKAMRRREEGKPVAGPRALKRQGYEHVPVEPISEFLESLDIPRSSLAHHLGIDERELARVTERMYKTTRLATVDKILTALGCPEELNALYPIEEEEKLVGYHYLDPDGVLQRPHP